MSTVTETSTSSDSTVYLETYQIIVIAILAVVVLMLVTLLIRIHNTSCCQVVNIWDHQESTKHNKDTLTSAVNTFELHDIYNVEKA